MDRRLLIERIRPYDELRSKVSARDVAQAEAFASPRRRDEYLSWRAALYEYLGRTVQIDYTPAGAPFVADCPEIHISVSHSADYVAVAVSDRRCAVDIERADRRFEHVMPRYVSQAEQPLCREKIHAAVVWCAKEAMYKYAGREGADFLRDIRVTDLAADLSYVEGRLVGLPPMRLSVRFVGDNVVVFLL